MKRLLLILLLLTAEGGARPPGALAPTALTFYPDWFAGPQFAGIYLAEDLGYFKDAGLKVTVVPFAFGRKTDPVAADRTGAAAGCIEGYILLQHQARGEDLRPLAATLQESPAGYLSLAPIRLRSAADFAGKKVGVHRYGDVVYRWLLQRAGVPESAATLSFVDNDIGRLLRGEVEVMQGYSTEEFLRLKAQAGSRAQFISQRALGFDGYSEVIYSTGAQMGAHRAAIDAFVAAARRGWIAAFEQPDQALAALRRRMPDTFDAAFERASLLALQPLVCPDGQPPFAPMRAERWSALSPTR